MRVSALALVGLLVSSRLTAQAPQQPVFRGGVEVVEVDVSVVDDRGHPVADLLRPEFTVSIDGRPRRVVSAVFVSLRPAATRERPTDPVPPGASYSSNATSVRGRLIVIAVDSDSIPFGEGRQATRAASKFLDRLGPNDKVAFFTVPPSGPAVDFTSNHQLVRDALERSAGAATANRPVLAFDVGAIGITEAYAIVNRIDSLTAIAVTDRLCGGLRGAELQQCGSAVQQKAYGIVSELRERVDNSLRTLRMILEGLRDIDGPKSLVWISQGLAVDGPRNEFTAIARLAAAARTTVHVIMLDAPLADVTQMERSPSALGDRALDMRGLELLASRSAGALYRVSASADFAFERLERELSGYYLLGVESGPTDRDGKRHSIKVSVGRRGVTVRARRELQSAPDAPAKAESIQERLARVLRSPFATTELPLRLATYAYLDADTSKVRVVMATEIARADNTRTDNVPAEVSIGFMLLDTQGKIVASATDRPTLVAGDGPRGPVLEHAASLVLEPGTYTLKLAAIDDRGRRGSIEHTLTAWQMSGLPFALSDLLIADAPAKTLDTLRPPVEAHIVTGRMLAYLELYSDEPDFFGNAQVRVEVASDDSSPVLASGFAQLGSLPDPKKRVVSAVLPVEALPPGQYVARAIIMRGDQTIGQLSRPLQVAEVSAARAPAVLSAMLTSPVPFQRDGVLRSDVIKYFMDVLDQGRPALKVTTAQVRGGRFDGAARQAFDGGDQLAAAFLRGLELFAKGDLNQSATQFVAALRMEPDFAPASFYLGACYAAAGRDRDAMTAWRRALAGGLKTPVAYAALADAAVRLDDAQ